MDKIPIVQSQRTRRGSLLLLRQSLPSAPISFIGDSIIAKFMDEGRETWEKYYSPLNSANLGTIGDSTQMLIEKLEKDMLPLEETHTIVLMIGATDLRHKIKVPVVLDQIRKIIILLQGNSRPGGVKILLLGILPRGDINMDCNEAIHETNELLSHLENGFTVRFVNLEYTFWDKESGVIHQELFSKDKINLSPKGYQIIAETIAPVFHECIQVD